MIKTGAYIGRANLWRGYPSKQCKSVGDSLLLNSNMFLLVHSVMRRCNDKDAIAKELLKELHSMGITHTPDGVEYTLFRVRNALRKF